MMNSIRSILSKTLRLKTNHLIGGFIVIGILCFVFEQFLAPDPQSTAPDPTSVDTYIPEGMTLVPIDIQNIESLKNMLGSFGVVDLYAPSYEQNGRPKKMASAIKIMRAPLNPDVFAVLVNEDLAPAITQHPGSFIVTILNPKVTKSNLVKEKKSLQVISEM